MQVSRETSYEDLQKLLLKEMHASLSDNVLSFNQSPGLFNIRVADPAATPIQDEHPCISPAVEHPLYTEPIEQALALCADDSGPAHVKLILEWDEDTKQKIIHDDNDQIEEHASAKQVKINSDSSSSVTLEKCFELYTKEEVLGVEDAWHCPHCNKKREVVKKLGLWSLPDILVIHMKRFRQQSKQLSTSKLTMLVDFPLYGFDMTPHLAHAGIQQQQNYHGLGQTTLNAGNGWVPWKKPRIKQTSVIEKSDRTNDNLYDLYAICNHIGPDLQGGHYTAFCKNPYDSQWYCFDDTRVEVIDPTSLVTSAAYMLFYQRRGLFSRSISSSAASTSSSVSGLDHWVLRMPPFYSNNNDNSKEIERISENNDKKNENLDKTFDQETTIIEKLHDSKTEKNILCLPTEKNPVTEIKNTGIKDFKPGEDLSVNGESMMKKVNEIQTF